MAAERDQSDHMDNSIVYAQQMDEQDSLREFRQEFIIPTENGVEQVYFLGNSLGLQPRRTAGFINKVLQQWARYGVESFFLGDDPWMQYHDHLVQPLAQIVGARPAEIVVMNQLTVNLHLMMVSFYQPSGKRKKIICESKAFPSDQYMFETYLKHLGLDPGEILIEIAPRTGEHTIRIDDILHTISATGDELALVLWGGLNYYTGQVFDMAAITNAAHTVGAKCGFDLAHAAGNIALHLHNWNVDFACWCSYKYLNAGPGAIGAAYIHERYHTDPSIKRLAGWWGYDKDTRFAMQKGFKPVPSAEGWQLSTPSPILYAAHRASLEIFAAAGFDRLREKGRLLSAYLLYLLDDINAHTSTPTIEIITPRADLDRGCQVSMLMHRKGRDVFEQLGKAGIFADWREPNVIRVAAVPLYNRFEEVWRFADTVRQIIFAV
jgi:kynureninase